MKNSESEIIEEHDIVTLTEDYEIQKHDITEDNTPQLKAGETGTVVFIWKAGEVYEVEFLRDEKTIAVVTLKRNQIKKY